MTQNDGPRVVSETTARNLFSDASATIREYTSRCYYYYYY